jgi:hypothetical protein
MMEVVNGIPCFNCTDVDRAKKSGGEDPKSAKAADASASSSARLDLDKLAARAHVNDGQTNREALNENRPLASGPRGTSFNLLA